MKIKKKKETQKKTLLFSQADLTNTIAAFKYIHEFKKNFEIIYITFSPSKILDKLAIEEGIKLFHLPIFIDFRKRRSKPKNIYKQISKIEKEIGSPIQKIIFADPEFYEVYRKNKTSALSWFITIFYKYKEIIEKNDIKLHYCGGEDRLHNLIPYYLIKNRGGGSFLERIVPYYGITLTNDFFGKFSYKKIKNEDKFNIEEYIDAIKKKKVYFNRKTARKISYHRYIDMESKYIDLKDILKKILEVERINWWDRKNIYKNHNTKLIKTFIKTPLIKNSKIILSRLLTYKRLEKNQKYIYYPLHYTEDAQVRLKYPEAYNQYELIRNISINLPINIKLIVKEHPDFAGNYSFRELYKLSKLPNIIIVDPEISSKEIFRYADYIITINSTVGYEALFYDKPVIVMGPTFYDNFPGIIKIKNVSKLYQILTDTRLIENKKKEIKEKLREKTKGLLTSSLKYNYYNFYNKENIVKLRDLLIHCIGQDKKI